MTVIVTWIDVFQYYWTALFTYFRDAVYPRFLDIVTAPRDHLQMLWLIAPLLITAFLIEVYFGRHKEEELGWNTAYGNSIVLIFTTVNLFYYLYRTYGYQALISLEGSVFYKSLFVLVGFLYAFILLTIDFTHALNKKIAFFLSSSITVSVFSFIAIVLIYAGIPFDITTLVTALCIFLLVYLFFVVFRSIIPPTSEAALFLQQQTMRKMEEKQRKRLEYQYNMKKLEETVQIKTEKFLHVVKKLFRQ